MSSYSFSLLASFSRISVASYLEYSSKVSVQIDNSEYIQKKIQNTYKLGLEIRNATFRSPDLKTDFFFKFFIFCKPIPQPSCCNLALIPLNVTPQTRPGSLARTWRVTLKCFSKTMFPLKTLLNS